MQHITDRFWRQGYLVLEDFFPAKLMQQAHEHMVTHYAQHPEGMHNEEFLRKSATDVIPWFPEREGVQVFSDIAQDKKLAALTEAILGSGWQALYCMTMFSRAGTQGQAWHQDCPPEDPAQFNLNRLVYTQDITTHTGGEVLIRPATHNTGELSCGEVDEDFADQVCLRPRQGTLVLLHGHCWHRVLPARQNRFSTNFRACPQGIGEDITDICVYRNMRYRFSTQEVIEQRTVG